MKIYLLPLTLFLASGLSLAHSATTVLMDETFNYSLGGLSTPWTVTTGNGSTVNVATAATLNDFTPTGNQITFDRPTSSTLPSAKLVSGNNPGTTGISTTIGAQYHLTLDFSYSTGTTLQFLLSSGTNFAGFKVASGAMLYENTNSVNGFTALTGSPTLSTNTWYELTLDVTIVDLTHSMTNLSLSQLGTGGSVIYSATDLALASGASFGTTTNIGLTAAMSGGTSNFSVANIDLLSVPEPSQMVLLVSSAVLLLGFRLRRVGI